MQTIYSGHGCGVRRRKDEDFSLAAVEEVLEQTGGQYPSFLSHDRRKEGNLYHQCLNGKYLNFAFCGQKEKIGVNYIIRVKGSILHERE